MLDESLELIPDENESMLSSQRTITVNQKNDDEFSVTGYKRNNVFTGLFYILGFLSLGFVFLLSYWYPHKRLKFSHDICYLENATSLLIVHTNGGQCSVKKIKSIKVNSGGIDDKDLVNYEKSLLTHNPVFYFEHMFLRYYFNDQFTDVHEQSGLDNLFTLNDIEKMKNGLSSEVSKLKATIHNFNFIDVPLKSYVVVCIELAANPFYCFQLFSVILWYTDEYQYYASVILFLTVISLAITTYETRKHMKKLHDMVGESTTVSVLRKSHEITKLDSKLLVPGDLFIIPHSGLDVPCDAVLITGRCIVNESSLTGESFPVTKTAVDRLVGTDGTPTVFSLSKNKQHALYNGTKVLEAHCLQTDPRSQQVLALVIRTGFTTLKGRLVRSIIHPKPVHFRFFRDSMKFILTFGFIAFLGFIYSLVTFVNHGEDAGYVIRRSLDLFTIAIPPALPACMSIGIMHAMHNLKNYHIYSIDPDRINLCAKIKLFVFDKTGTLTEDRLTVNGVIVNDKKELSQLKTEVDSMKDEAEILKAMASCHSLSILNHEIIGDPLDLSMFEFTKWQLNDQARDQSCITVSPTRGKQTIEILKQYMFDSSLRRMSVIAKENEDVSLKVYTKGSPEMLLSLCNKNTIPTDANEVLDSYTIEGARVLAVARKVLRKELTAESDLREKFPRKEIEKDLDFLGFIVFQNVVKPGSKATINTLQKANIRCVMATGDNLKTAAAVSRQVDIIKEMQSTVKIKVENGTVKFNVLSKSRKYSAAGDTVLKINEPEWVFNQELYMTGLPYVVVLTGNTYKKLKALNQPKVLENVLLSAGVFARMSPEDKVTLIEDLKSLNYGVGMCGDGANDCGALKAAHAGNVIKAKINTSSKALWSVRFPKTCWF